jgi:hypothetical protein
VFVNIALVRFNKNNTEKKTFTKTSIHLMFFSYMEHLLKPLYPIEEVITEFFLKILTNFVTAKTSAKICARMHSPWSAGFIFS